MYLVVIFMTVAQIICASLLIISSIAIIIVVLLQEGRSAGLSGAISGGADTFFGKQKGRTIEQKLIKMTKYIAITFFILSLGTTIAFMFMY